MTPNLGKAVLALDDFLTRADPAEIAAVAQAAQAAPVWLRDQFQAATDQVQSAFREIAGKGLRADRHPEWVRLGLLETLTSWLAGRADTCIHNPRPERPEPVTAAAWKPNLVVCCQCSHLMRLPSSGPADRRCDACGRVTTGPQNNDAIYPAMVALGLFTYAVGMCAGCRYDEDQPGAA